MLNTSQVYKGPMGSSVEQTTQDRLQIYLDQNFRARQGSLLDALFNVFIGFLRTLHATCNTILLDMTEKKCSLKFNTSPVNIQQHIHCTCMHTYTHVHIQIHKHVPTCTFYLSTLCTQSELWQLTEAGIREFSSVLGLAQLLGKEKAFLPVLAFYTTAIEANKAKVKGAVHSTCKSAKNSHVPAWKATHMAIITLRSTVKYCHPGEGRDRSLTVLPP